MAIHSRTIAWIIPWTEEPGRLQSIGSQRVRHAWATSLHTRIAPKEQVGFSPYEMLYGRPFVYVNDLFIYPEAQTLQAYPMAIGQFQQDICLWGVNQDPEDSKESPLPGTQVLIKVWKDEPKGSTPAHMEGPLPCNSLYPHRSQGTRTWLLDSLLMSSEENRRGHSIHLWAPGISQIRLQNYKWAQF